MATTTLQSVAQWARDLGIPQRTLARRLDGVQPDRATRRANFYSLAVVIKAALPDILSQHEIAGGADDEMTLAEATRRQRQAAARLAEYELAERQAVMMDVRKVKTELDRTFGNIRAKLLAIPSKYSPVVSPSDPGKAQRLLEAAIHETLIELQQSGDDSGADGAA